MTQEVTETSRSQNTSDGLCHRKPYSPMCRKLMVFIALTSTAFLVAGAFAGGWLQLRVELKLRDDFSYYSDPYDYYNVYQDYGLWSVTQCKQKTFSDVFICETRSYTLLEGLGEDVMAELKFDGHKPSDVSFDGISLVFSYSNMWFVQTVYVIGTVTSMFSLYMALHLKTNTPKKVSNAITRQNVISYNILPAILVFIPVIMFGLKHAAINSGEKRATPFGLVLGAMGGVVLFIGSGFMCFHTRICACTGCIDQPQDPEEVVCQEPVLIDDAVESEIITH